MLLNKPDAIALAPAVTATLAAKPTARRDMEAVSATAPGAWAFPLLALAGQGEESADEITAINRLYLVYLLLADHSLNSQS
jgi:hypothetical protein